MKRLQTFCLAAIGLLLTATPARAQTDFPVVYVDARITAPLYRDQLQASLTAIESGIAASFVRYVDDLGALDFIVWKVGPAPSDTDDNRLIIEIEGIERLLGTEIRAHFYSVVAGAGMVDLGATDDEGKINCNPILFDAIDEKFAQDPERLAGEIDRWMEQHVTDSFGAILTRKFLGHITLALITPPNPILDFDKGANLLPIPIRYSAYFPEDTTQFRAEFRSSFVGTAVDGRMLLRPTGSLSEPGFADDILVSISCSDGDQRCFDYPNLELKPDDDIAGRWDDIRSVLSNDHLQELRLFMVKYRRRPYMHTTGGLITEETPGGM
ncbi:MAG: hypothetical protein R2834_02510 [Rhodothermales bacterium]